MLASSLPTVPPLAPYYSSIAMTDPEHLHHLTSLPDVLPFKSSKGFQLAGQRFEPLAWR
jgi:hypothetical protein